MIFIDSNILIDVTEDDSRWSQWSIDRIVNESVQNQLVINQFILAEVAPQSGSLEKFYADIGTLGIIILELSDEAAFTAGSAFLKYRRNRGEWKTVLPDFLIGGHAQVLGATILTRDPRFYRTYFPMVPLITPDKAEP